MEKISVENYRSIVKCDNIDLRPITVLVGKNSAGKSSFIRLFPLLKQSLERKISDPLLWFGDYVDFGSFNNVISKTSFDDPLVIRFTIKMASGIDMFGLKDIGFDNVDVELLIREKYFCGITIGFNDQFIKLNIDENSKVNININGDDDIFIDKNIYAYRESGALLPTLYQEIEDKEHKKNEKYFSFQIDFSKEIARLDEFIYGKDYKGKQNIFKNRFFPDYYASFGSKDDFVNKIIKFNPDKFKNLKKKKEILDGYVNLYIAIQIQGMVRRLNDTILAEMKQTSYIKPIRAMVDRYYRVKGVSIDELDADGSNLPMILKNMTLSELRNFEKWSKQKFGVVFSVKEYEGHISMIIRNDVDGNEETNVADTGYGYSQMLPIVMLLWMIHNNKTGVRLDVGRTIVIEQPELHLHPAYQAKMMDVFVNVVKELQNKRQNIKIIFETHSEVMINRLGALISSQKISKDDVNILVFEKKGSETNIQSRLFDENGLLLGWPSGFLSSEE